MSGVRCHVSGSRFHMLGVTYNFLVFLYLFFDKVVEPVGGGSVIHGPCLVLLRLALNIDTRISLVNFAKQQRIWVFSRK